MEVAEQLHAPDYQLITPRGKALSKTEYLHAVATRELHYSAFEAITPMDVWGDEQIALIRYRARIGFHDSPAPPIECWHTDCYRSNDGNWQAGRVVTSDNGSVIRRSRRKYHTVCPAAGNGPPDADIVHDVGNQRNGVQVRHFANPNQTQAPKQTARPHADCPPMRSAVRAPRWARRTTVVSVDAGLQI